MWWTRRGREPRGRNPGVRGEAPCRARSRGALSAWPCCSGQATRMGWYDPDSDGPFDFTAAYAYFNATEMHLGPKCPIDYNLYGGRRTCAASVPTLFPNQLRVPQPCALPALPPRSLARHVAGGASSRA